MMCFCLVNEADIGSLFREYIAPEGTAGAKGMLQHSCQAMPLQ